ncbi:hypothetical protein AVEN_268608-1 [Araneus ventricosus]|uniref:Uncharacterized protein n=1 Tax=Araneus ventricosus TaxID=182803 RepID=A0A4Y2H2K3_ARAVE|nr:hypothetical protein AVEN_268608-1 [Araneus ventricosus]
MKRLEKLLAEISTNKENKGIVDDELVSEHKLNSKEELDNESNICESTNNLEERNLELKNGVKARMLQTAEAKVVFQWYVDQGLIASGYQHPKYKQQLGN